MARFTPDEQRSHRRLFAALSLVLAAVTVWAVVDEVHTRRPWKVHQQAWLTATGQPGPPRVQQLVVPALDAVDRCTTCHAGIDRPETPAPDLPRVLAPHPDHGTLLGNHPPERFGCVSCHAGLGVALTGESAHASESGHWIDPLLPGPYAQSRCLACHPDDQDLAGAPLLSRGRALFNNLGCDDCHLAEDDSGGAQSPHKRGPSLRYVASKLRPGALLQQIQAPQARRLGHRMPNFWPGAEDDPAMRARRDEESLAISAFLLASSTAWPAEAASTSGESPPPGATPAAPAGADPARGEWLFDRVGCRGCHVLGTEDGDDVVIDDEAKASPEADSGDAWGSFGSGDGGDAWGSFGGAEDPTPEPTTAPAATLGHGPALGTIAARVLPGFFAPWLQDPASYSAATTMPSLRLDQDEAAALGRWLSTLGEAEAPATPPQLAGVIDPALVERGRGLVADFGCFGCHDIPGFEDEGRPGPDLSEYGRKTRQQMHFGEAGLPAQASAWHHYTRTKLRQPRAFESAGIPQFMPEYTFAEGEVEALAVFLRGLRGDSPPSEYVHQPPEPAAVRRGRQVAAEVNCAGCHTLDGVDGTIRQYFAREPLMPPVLDGEGERVRPDWLYGFLLEPSPLRPWLKVRMPSFGLDPAEVEDLVAWIGHRDGQPAAWRPSPSRPMSYERAAMAEAMFVDLKCVSCHQLAGGGGVKSADLAPDLGLARQRLARRWVIRFLEDPGAMLPGTRMPQFFPDGQSPFPDLLDGSAEAQMELLVDHLMNLGLQPTGSPPAPPSDPPEQGAPREP